MALLGRPVQSRPETRSSPSRIDTRVGSQRGVPGRDLTHNQVHFYISKNLTLPNRPTLGREKKV
jgi:hypothetical protein